MKQPSLLSQAITPKIIQRHATIIYKMLQPSHCFQTLIPHTQYQGNLPAIPKTQQPSPLSQTIYNHMKKPIFKKPLPLNNQ